MIISCSDLRIGAGNADDRNVGILKVLAACDGNAGAIGTENDGDIAGYQLLSGRRCLIGGGAVVCIDKLNLVGFATDLYSRRFNVGILHTEHFLLSACTAVTAGRLKDADPDNVLCKNGCRDHHGKAKKNDQKFFHGPLRSFLVDGGIIA